MTDDIKAAVHSAAASNRKIAMFHFQILMHADELQGVDPVAFCKELAIPTTYATEFRKMLSLARLMKEQGVRTKFPRITGLLWQASSNTRQGIFLVVNNRCSLIYA